MLSAFFDSAARVHALRAGPGGTLLEGFAQTLSHAGYAAITARRHLRAAEHFIYWANRHGTLIPDLTEQSLERFSGHLRGCRCPRYGHTHTHRLDVRHGARLFFTYPHEAGVITLAAVERSVHDAALLKAFRQWMRHQRGTCESTVDNYARHIRALLRRLGEEPATFDARSLRQFFCMPVETPGGQRPNSVRPPFECFCGFWSRTTSAPRDWKRRSRSWHTGVWPRSPVPLTNPSFVKKEEME